VGVDADGSEAAALAVDPLCAEPLGGAGGGVSSSPATATTAALFAEASSAWSDDAGLLPAVASELAVVDWSEEDVSAVVLALALELELALELVELLLDGA
jgi:hypothetical protein